jgi:feruloyl esterase
MAVTPTAQGASISAQENNVRLHLRIGFGAAACIAFAHAGLAATSCTPEALNTLNIPGFSVTEAKTVSPTPQGPSHCAVLGTVVTRGDGAPDGLARFSMQLPDEWKQRFLFLGVGGNAGTLQPSANAVDRAQALKKGYAIVLTDTGHVGDGTSAKWVRRQDGSLDQPKVADFLFRAAHGVTVAAKAFAEAFYAAPIQHAYFDGCSTGGRMALVSAIRYPDDFHGVISGDPAMDFNLNLARAAVQKAILANPSGHIPEQTLAALDARIVAQCDALDGAMDGLVQNPAACTVTPNDLLCRPGELKACLTQDQVAVLKTYVNPLRDRRGSVAYPGWPVAHLAGAQGASYLTFGKQRPDPSDPKAPWGVDEGTAPRAWRLGTEGLSYWLGYGPSATVSSADIDVAGQVAGDDLLARTRSIMGAGEGMDPAKIQPFFARGGKMILYHGASDPSIPAARTVMYYEQLTALMKGTETTQRSARLFLVPGMHHCSGGPGPDQFDTLSALEAWVEQGQAPTSILASTRSDALVRHEVPLCPYPQQAKYTGAGAIGVGTNWRCEVESKIANGTRRESSKGSTRP